MWHEFMTAVKDKWPNAIIQFEDISNDHCFELLNRYRDLQKCFNDDIQGTGAVIAAGFHSACRIIDIPLEQHKILFFGAGSSAIGVADQICNMVNSVSGTSLEEVRNLFYFFDSQGLVTTTRGDQLADHKIKYARSDVSREYTSLLAAVEDIKPTALIGLSGIGGSFDEKIITTMGQINHRPIIFALSNPTSNAECLPNTVYSLTQGRALYVSGAPIQSTVTLDDGKTYYPGHGSNVFIYPGLGFGAYVARSKISESMVTTAATTLAKHVTDEDLKEGRLYPPLEKIRTISLDISAAVMEKSYEEGLAGRDRPAECLTDFVRNRLYLPSYPTYAN
eukprot:TRINITY_DN9095_c0_g1_i5.p1 TRINITY_DN9095_c0_g1~~TRINITY_DN9095_c0_g1_i5.p1  ORF type:complete len:389 (-),score=96.90 TRINITY_DN9095_c0_g1_i5:183-1187(-)